MDYRPSIPRVVVPVVLWALLSTPSIPVGSAEPLFPLPVQNCGADPRGMAATDLDGDGHLDLVVADEGFGDVWVYLSRGDGLFEPGVAYDIGCCNASVAVGDFDENGDPDVAVAGFGDGAPDRVVVLLGNGDGTLGAPTFYECVTSCDRHVAIGDFNEDDHQDLLARGTSGTLLLGDGLGGFTMGDATGGEPPSGRSRPSPTSTATARTITSRMTMARSRSIWATATG